MTAYEIALVALGLLVGIALGAVLVGALGDRSRGSSEVRVTMMPDAVPRRRAATLSGDPFGTGEGTGRGGPADDHGAAPAPAAARGAATGDRTAVPTGPGPFTLTPAPAPTLPRVAMPPRIVTSERPAAAAPERIPPNDSGRVVPSRLTPVRVETGVDPLIEELRREHRPVAAAVAAGGAVAARAAAQPDAGAPRPTAQAEAEAASSPHPAAAGPSGSDAGTATERAAGTPGGAQILVDPNSPCADARRTAAERCEVASRARGEAERAHDTLRAAQRSYDDELARADEAARATDPRSVRARKDEAQAAFRLARAAATTSDAVDAAARDWLQEINRINRETRAAAATVTRAQEAARALAGSLERLSAEAGAARIAAEVAEEACMAARQALADCEEASARSPETPAEPEERAPGPWYDDSLAASTAAGTALGDGTAPTIFRLLEGDHDALLDVVARLAGDDPEARRHWQLLMSDLVDAVLATAIDNAALEFPQDHPFWGPFSAAQARDIVGALASLGYRFDGLGGWLDGRVPSQRDLSLALGYAGLDPMRIRQWPTEQEMFELFGQVRVAAPEYLAGAAGDLTLGELVAMLGRRAEGLTDVWNAWGRVRPLLLEER